MMTSYSNLTIIINNNNNNNNHPRKRAKSPLQQAFVSNKQSVPSPSLETASKYTA